MPRPSRSGRRRKYPTGFWKYTEPGAKPLRVTLWVSDEIREEIRAMAKKNCELTHSKRPRTGVIVTALVTMALEHLHEDPTK